MSSDTTINHRMAINAFHHAASFNEFRVFVNSTRHEVVFAFKGLSLNLNNWRSDVSSNDQGATQYAAIESAAEQLYTTMSADSAYSIYQFIADGVYDLVRVSALMAPTGRNP